MADKLSLLTAAITAAYFLYLGVGAAKSHWPFVYQLKHLFWIIVLNFLPAFVSLTLRTMRGWVPVTSALEFGLGLLAILVFFWWRLRDLSVLGATSDELSAAFKRVLNTLNLPFDERIGKFELPTKNSVIEIKCSDFWGASRLHMKGDEASLREITTVLAEEFKATPRSSYVRKISFAFLAAALLYARIAYNCWDSVVHEAPAQTEITRTDKQGGLGHKSEP